MSNSCRPKVSIGMPVYNGEVFIRDALDSLVAQSFANFELIISDNASTDHTEAICRRYASQDSRINYVRQTKNIGADANFQFVLDKATGEYFMWNAADDFRSKDCIEYYLSKIGNAGGVFTTYAVINRKDGSIVKRNVPELSTLQSRRESLKRFFIKNNSSFYYGLYKRQALKECRAKLNGPFDWSDSYTVLKIIENHGFHAENCEPKYFAGIYGSYVVKPYKGKYLRPFKYFRDALGLAIFAGPIAFLYHLKILFKSLKLNVRIWRLSQ